MKSDKTSTEDESNTDGGDTNADNIWAAVSDDSARIMTDGGMDNTPNIVEYIPADKNPDGEAVKRFVHLRNGSWDIRAHRYLEEDPNYYRAMCDDCGDLFETFGRAESHVKTCGEDVDGLPEPVTDGGSDKATPRDRAWLAVIDLLGDAHPMTLDDIAQGGNVHENTARAVLHVAEDYDLLERDSPQAHTYHPTIGPLGDVDDPEYRRAIRTLIAESNRED